MSRLIASGFGSGLILRRVRGSDPGSGTVGSILTVPIAIGVGMLWGWMGQVVLLAILVVAGLWALRRLANEGDAAWIVIDEAAGTVLATIGLGWGPGLVALAVFRLVDIMKRPFPGVSQAEAIPGPWGVMADDLMAGLYGLGAGHVVSALL